MLKNKKLNLIGKILSLISIGFIIYAIWKKGFDFSFVKNVPVFILVFAAGIILKLLSLWNSSFAWTRWLTFFSRKPFDKKEAQNVFIRANIGKYIPGNVMHFVQRNLFASGMGLSQLQLTMSTVFEIISYVTVALIVSLLTARESLAAVLTKYFGDKLPILGIAAGCVAAAIIVVLIILRKKIRKALEGYELKDFLKALLTVMAHQLVTLVTLGGVLVMLVWYATGTMSLQTAGTVLSAYIVAWVLGYVVPGASGGAGIRETALYLLLGPLLGEDLVLALSLVHRLITIIGDFLGYLIVILKEKKNGGAVKDE